MTKSFYRQALAAEAKNARVYQFWKLAGDHSSRAACFLRTMQYYRTRGLLGRLIALWCNTHLIKDYGIFVHPGTQIGLGLSMPHPNGIVIGSSVTIGENATIYQQVTIGSARQGD